METNRISPPITVVTTTTTSPISTQRQRIRQPQSAHANTPIPTANTILTRPSPTIDKPTPKPPAPVSIHHLPPPPKQPLQQLHPHHQPHGDSRQDDEAESDPPVDAALLSALRDQRERVALLRLEQKLVEFTNDPALVYVDVGPGSNGDGGGMSMGASGGMQEEDGAAVNPASSALHRELQNMNLRTSFHRKCLHKLADRFRITRETADNNAIRLIKGFDSAVPSKLLFDLVKEINTSSGSMMNAAMVDGARYGKRTAGAPASPVGMFPVGDAPQDRIDDANNGINSAIEGVSNIQINTNQGAPAGSRERKKTKKKEKIKIFQRSGAQKGSAGSLSQKDGSVSGDSNSSRRKKNLSDKEKAYAEARARIFNSSSENTNIKSNSTSTTQAINMDESFSDQGNSNSSRASTNTVSVQQDANPPVPVTTGVHKFTPASVGVHKFTPASVGVHKFTPASVGVHKFTPNSVGVHKFTPNSVASAEFFPGRHHNNFPVTDVMLPLTSSSTTTNTTNNLSSHQIATANDSSTESANASRTNTPTANNKASNNAPAAVTSGATSKVTWRNRQQEASDPDFQRGVHVVGGLGVPMSAGHPPPVSYHYHSNHHHHPTSAHQPVGMPGVGAGMGHNIMNGYHYNGGGDGGGVVPANTGVGRGMLDLSAYNQNEPSSNWQRQDGGAVCGLTATDIQQSQQIPPVIFSNQTTSTHHSQYQVLSQQQHQYSSPLGLQLAASGGGSGVMTIATNQQRDGTGPLLRESSRVSGDSQLVYTAEDFPALG